MIIGMHAIMYSKNADETRRFFKDTLGWNSVDAGRGWLIFAAPPSEVAVHPTENDAGQELYLMCDDIAATIAELNAKGVETGPISDQRWGRLTHIVLPSGETLGVYEPRHPLAIDRAK